MSRRHLATVDVHAILAPCVARAVSSHAPPSTVVIALAAAWDPGHWLAESSGRYVWIDGHWRS
jgi:hypothetical protein